MSHTIRHSNTQTELSLNEFFVKKRVGEILSDFEYTLLRKTPNEVIVDIESEEFAVSYYLIYAATPKETLEFTTSIEKHIMKNNSKRSECSEQRYQDSQLEEILCHFYNKITELEQRVSELESVGSEASDDDIAREIVNTLINEELLRETNYDATLNYAEDEIEIILEHDDGVTVVKVPEELFYAGDEEDIIEYFS